MSKSVGDWKSKIKKNSPGSHPVEELTGINDSNNVNVDDNDIINNDVNVNINENINENVNESDTDYVDQLISGKKKKDNGLVLKGIYFPKEVAREIDRLSKNGGKGAQSRLVTEAVVKLFKEKGIL